MLSAAVERNASLRDEIDIVVNKKAQETQKPGFLVWVGEFY